MRAGGRAVDQELVRDAEAKTSLTATLPAADTGGRDGTGRFHTGYANLYSGAGPMGRFYDQHARSILTGQQLASAASATRTAGARAGPRVRRSIMCGGVRRAKTRVCGWELSFATTQLNRSRAN